MYRRIRDLREDNDLTQQQIADMLGCGQSIYSKYERGFLELPIWALIKLAKFYNVTTDYILGLSDKER